jgi:tyrosyl-tRNA synthetase
MEFTDNTNIESKVNRILSIGEEVIGGENLSNLLINKSNVIAYDGFEPSGRMHIAQGLLRAHNTNKFVDSGVRFKFWVADWFALMNLKLGGDLNKIQKAGKLMIETWKACGMKLDAVDSDGNPMIEFIWSSEEINARSDEYWKLVLDIGTKFTLNRIKKCTQIMGRKEEADNVELLLELNDEITKLFFDIERENYEEHDHPRKKYILSLLEKLTLTSPQELAASQIFYPVMQCADVFFLRCDIVSLGMDQRKCNALALEYCDKIKRKNKPIVISHHMIMGLDGSDKMSKSNPDNTVFMDDTEADVKRKITKAFCEPCNVQKNPLLDWAKYIIFPLIKKMVIPENLKWNDPEMIFLSWDELSDAFAKGKVQPKALKDSMIIHINDLLNPIRIHFATNKEANELLKQVKSYTK